MSSESAKEIACRDRKANPVPAVTREEYDQWLKLAKSGFYMTQGPCVCGPFLWQRDMNVPFCSKHPLYTKCMCDLNFWNCRFHAPGTVTDGPHNVPFSGLNGPLIRNKT